MGEESPTVTFVGSRAGDETLDFGTDAGAAPLGAATGGAALPQATSETMPRAVSVGVNRPANRLIQFSCP